tara:strand:+ start:2252 stop:2740 length:489 start_codon:yes stop_codon:yes gene_type:complete
MQYAKKIDNFLSEEDFIPLSDMLNSFYFPWYFNDQICYESDGLSQFTHTFFEELTRSPNSDFYPLVECFLDKLEVKELIRIKANLNVKTEVPIQTGYHIDYPDATTAVFYLNTNNGGTELNKTVFVESIANRILIFDSNTQHTGVTCTDQLKRISLNFNYRT